MLLQTVFSNLVMPLLLVSHASHNRGHLCMRYSSKNSPFNSQSQREVGKWTWKAIIQHFLVEETLTNISGLQGKNKILDVDLFTVWCLFFLRTALVNVWRGLGLVWPWPPSVMWQPFSWPPLFQSQHSEPSPYRFVCVCVCVCSFLHLFKQECSSNSLSVSIVCMFIFPKDVCPNFPCPYLLFLCVCACVPNLHWLQISPHDFYWFHSSNQACDRLRELAWPITPPTACD